MQTLVRSFILIGLAVWVGGILFFGTVVAPVAFELGDADAFRPSCRP